MSSISIRRRCPSLMINSRSKHSSLTVLTQRSVNGFAFGERYGVSTLSIPPEASTALKEEVNLAPWSWIKKRIGNPLSPSRMSWMPQKNYVPAELPRHTSDEAYPGEGNQVP